MALASVVCLPTTLASARARAEGTAVAERPAVYEDLEGFSITVPPGWVQAEGLLPGNASFTGASGERRTIAWFPANAAARDVNVTLTITNTSVEFTKLGSFGNVYAFASTLVASQDRSYLLRAPEWVRKREVLQMAKLLDAQDTGSAYIVEYTIEKPPEPARYLLSLVTLAPSARYNRLYTVTAQCLASDVDRYQAVLKEMTRSFVPPAKSA